MRETIVFAVFAIHDCDDIEREPDNNRRKPLRWHDTDLLLEMVASILRLDFFDRADAVVSGRHRNIRESLQLFRKVLRDSLTPFDCDCDARLCTIG